MEGGLAVQSIGQAQPCLLSLFSLFFFLTTQIHVQPSSRFLKVQWYPLYMLLHTILIQF